MSRIVAVALLALAACELPPLTLKFRLTDGPAQKCIANGDETTDCADITMACRAVLSLRIVPPNEPDFPYVSICQPLAGAQNSLCSIASPDLPPPNRPVPEQVLEIQVAVFQRDQLATDADGNYICPRVQFAADGLPETAVDCTEGGECPVRPAVGGRAFYYPGDEETVVELGCTEISLLTAQSCEGPPLTNVIATVNDFDNWVPVESTTANRLTVSIGEPKEDVDGAVSLVSAQPLPRATQMPPTWEAAIDFTPQTTYCVEVFEDVPQATRSLVCRSVPSTGLPHDVLGAWLAKTTLTDILKAKGRTTFPEQGLVVGAVVDRMNNPMAGVVVDASDARCPSGKCTIEYLSADRQSFTTDRTSANGIWISTDAPYGTVFSRVNPLVTGFGGLVRGKVTIVVLQESATTGGS